MRRRLTFTFSSSQFLFLFFLSFFLSFFYWTFYVFYYFISVENVSRKSRRSRTFFEREYGSGSVNKNAFKGIFWPAVDVFAYSSVMFNWIVHIWVWFERSLFPIQYMFNSGQNWLWTLKLMASQVVQWTIICTVGNGWLECEWVKAV